MIRLILMYMPRETDLTIMTEITKCSLMEHHWEGKTLLLRITTLMILTVMVNSWDTNQLNRLLSPAIIISVQVSLDQGSLQIQITILSSNRLTTTTLPLSIKLTNSQWETLKDSGHQASKTSTSLTTEALARISTEVHRFSDHPHIMITLRIVGSINLFATTEGTITLSKQIVALKKERSLMGS